MSSTFCRARGLLRFNSIAIELKIGNMEVSYRRDRLRSPEFFFFCSSICVGLLLICLTPPMQTPDEGAHFERAWQIAEGGIVPERREEGTGGVLPVSVNSFCRWFEQFNHDSSSRIPHPLKTYREWHDQPVDPDKRMFIVFSNTAAYPPLPYLPQAAGIFVARVGGASVPGCLLLCRLFNLLTAVAVTVLAIRISPVQRWTMVLLALTPMSMYLNASASSDALTNAIAMLFVASILRFTYGVDCECPRRQGAWLLLLAVLLGLIKQGYFPLALLAVLIPWQSGEARRVKWVFAIAILVVTAISVATWGIVVQSTYSPMRDNIDPAAQLTHVR